MDLLISLRDHFPVLPPPVLTVLVFLLRGLGPLQGAHNIFPSKNACQVARGRRFCEEFGFPLSVGHHRSDADVAPISSTRSGPESFSSRTSTTKKSSSTYVEDAPVDNRRSPQEGSSSMNSPTSTAKSPFPPDPALADLSALRGRRTQHEFVISSTDDGGGEASGSTSGSGDKMPYQLFLPDAPGTVRHAGLAPKLPLILFLHGAGDGPYGVMNAQSLPRLLGPDCWQLEFFASSGVAMKWNLDECRYFRDPTQFPFAVLMPVSGHPSRWGDAAVQKRTVRLLTHVIQQLGVIDADRVILVGQSAGGRGALEMAVNFPTEFAAVVPVCFAGVSDAAERAIVTTTPAGNGGRSLWSLPFWLVHAEDDSVVPIGETSDLLFRELQRARGTAGARVVGPVEYGTDIEHHVVENHAGGGAAGDSVQGEIGGNGRGGWGGIGTDHSSVTSGEVVGGDDKDSRPFPGEVVYSRYKNAPGPPIPEYASMVGHASYDLAFRDVFLYRWMAKQRRGGKNRYRGRSEIRVFIFRDFFGGEARHGHD